MRNRMPFAWMLILAVAIAAGVANASPVALPSSVDFGTMGINTSSTVPIDITIDSNYRIASFTGSGRNAPFSFSINTCGSPFEGPGTCTVKETFAATSFGPASGSLDVLACPITGGDCSGITIPISANAVSLAGATAIDFGSVLVGTTKSGSSTITVDSGYLLESFSGGGLSAPFSFSANTCDVIGSFHGPGSCTIDESFLPTSVGPVSTTTSVFECPVKGGDCIGISVAIKGTGVSPAPPAVPEPASIALVGIAFAGLARRRRRA